MPWKYHITVNIDPHSRNQGIKLCRHYLLALWLLLAEHRAWKSLQCAVPQGSLFYLHILLPCIIMSVSINTRLSGHTQPTDMVHVVSFHPSVVSGCSRPATKSCGKIKVHQFRYLPLRVHLSSLSSQTNQGADALFFLGRVRQATNA